MNFKRFAIYVVIGEVLQMFFYVAIGYIFSDTWQTIYGAVGKFSWIIAIALAVIFTVASAKIINKKMS